MKKIVLLPILFLTLAFGLQAQDQAIFNQYNISPILVHPAYAGFEEAQNVQLNFRNQWTGFPGAPTTYAINYNGYIGNTLGLGANLLSENVASLNRLKFQLNYAFRFPIGEKVKIATGFSTDFTNMRINNSASTNPFYQPGDQIVEGFENGEQIFDASVGVYASFNDNAKNRYRHNNTQIGVTFPNLIVARISDIENRDPEGEFFKFFVLSVSHRMFFEDLGISLEPSMIMRRVMDVPFSMDFNMLTGFFEDRFMAGLSYRSGVGGTLGIMLGTNLMFGQNMLDHSGWQDAVRIFYSYDLSFQEFQQYNSGAHELTLALRFGSRARR
jgi:type IX secretion system PorP/SprF family membrane protein